MLLIYWCLIETIIKVDDGKVPSQNSNNGDKENEAAVLNISTYLDN